METVKIYESEYRLCKIVWKNEPIKSGKLVELCNEELGWKPSTTYTVIKKLTERGILVSEKMMVSSLIKEDEAQASIVREMLDSRFDSSGSAFIAAFAKSKTLTDKDIDEIQEMLNKIKEQRK
ncbi:MAG: BlaI/MecI/CopY family transcriptional regulator [Lachnospiraceae bacterium]|nr:BlaI/MecI/CopY family transcriptional regulator [Lachnospiraceae bacterium]